MSSVPSGGDHTWLRHQAHDAITGIAIASVLALLLILVSAALGGGLASFFGQHIDLVANQALVLDKWRGALLPEPVERSAYLAGVLATLPACIIAAKLLGTRYYGKAAQKFALIGICFVMAGIAYFGINSVFLQDIFDGRIFPVKDRSKVEQPLTFITAVLMSIAFLAAAIHAHWSPAWVKRLSSVTMLVVLGLYLVFTMMTRIHTPDTLFGDLHFEAVFYTLTQVSVGKTLLADLPTQYGLYAEIIAPITRLTGISVIGFTLFLAILQSISVLCVFHIMSATISSALIRPLALFSVLLFFGSTWIFMRQSTFGYEYYQIWPIRVFFPSLLMAWMILMIKRGFNGRALSIFSVVSGLGIAWNNDWGLVAYGAVLAYFLMRAFTSQDQARRANIKFLAIVTVIPLAVLGAFLLYLAIKSGFQTRVQDWTKYQAIFYRSGFGMLPLKGTESAWKFTLIIYLIGIVYPIAAHFKGKQDLQSDAAFLLSITGIGIFTYFQGRSHDIVLSFVIWPAVIIAFILVDKALGAARQNLVQPIYGWASLPFVVFGVMSAFVLVKAMPRLIDNARESVRLATSAPAGKASSNIAFVRDKTRKGGTIAISSSGQAILFGETGLASNVEGPGTAETILRQDLETYVERLVSNPSEHVFIDAAPDGGLPPSFLSLVGTYEILDRSSTGLLYLAPLGVTK